MDPRVLLNEAQVLHNHWPSQTDLHERFAVHQCASAVCALQILRVKSIGYIDIIDRHILPAFKSDSALQLDPDILVSFLAFVSLSGLLATSKFDAKLPDSMEGSSCNILCFTCVWRTRFRSCFKLQSRQPAGICKHIFVYPVGKLLLQQESSAQQHILRKLV